MPRTKTKECCKIDAIVNVDSKGQLVLPKELRERANIKPNTKLALIAVEQANQVCCLVIMKTDALEGTVKCTLAPILTQAFGNEDENK
ncbi:MAG: HgcAB-associated protein [Candidatus Bathyarchaeota archaeon]|nr:HgcAB-associated protein [Candidatus Bathyarchaeota archaeon]